MVIWLPKCPIRSLARPIGGGFRVVFFSLPQPKKKKRKEGAAVAPPSPRRRRRRTSSGHHRETKSAEPPVPSGAVRRKTLIPFRLIWGRRSEEEGGPSGEDCRRGPYPLRRRSARSISADEPLLGGGNSGAIAGVEGQRRGRRGPAEGLPASVDDRQPSGVGLGLRIVTLGWVQEQ